MTLEPRRPLPQDKLDELTAAATSYLLDSLRARLEALVFQKIDLEIQLAGEQMRQEAAEAECRRLGRTAEFGPLRTRNAYPLRAKMRSWRASMEVTVGFAKILPDHVDDYIENMKVVAANSNQEPGCIYYGALQDLNDPTVMCLIMIFEDAEASKIHGDSEHHRIWSELNSSGGWRDRSAARSNKMRFITPAPVKSGTVISSAH